MLRSVLVCCNERCRYTPLNEEIPSEGESTHAHRVFGCPPLSLRACGALFNCCTASVADTRSPGHHGNNLLVVCWYRAYAGCRATEIASVIVVLPRNNRVSRPAPVHAPQSP